MLTPGFQSTLSLRRATPEQGPGGPTLLISIHALLAESDMPRCTAPRWSADFNPRSPCGERRLPSWWGLPCLDFNPRSPCGERRTGIYIRWELYRFQSTLSLRRATCNSPTVNHSDVVFQSTLSLRRATIPSAASPRSSRDFNPRSPCGERPKSMQLRLYTL